MNEAEPWGTKQRAGAPFIRQLVDGSMTFAECGSVLGLDTEEALIACVGGICWSHSLSRSKVEGCPLLLFYKSASE